jgi:hypothetical protein
MNDLPKISNTILDTPVISKTESWCSQDKHQHYEFYTDFNEWLDDLENEESISIRERYKIDGLTQPSKALYAGDLEAYKQAFKQYRIDRKNKVLKFSVDEVSDNHWYDRNCDRFDQLVDTMQENTVVPFIGAGISVGGGFPTWENHLRQQSRTAGINKEYTEELISNGQFEVVIDEIEKKRGRNVFVQEIRDVFSRTGEITGITLLLPELFSDTVITTNYDRLIEQVYDSGEVSAFQVIEGMNALDKAQSDRVTIHKLHGSVKNPANCIISKNQYDLAYGVNEIDLTLPIPKLLSYFFWNSSLLFLGCSLNNDRTVRVFQEVNKLENDFRPQHFSIEQAPKSEEELAWRNEYLLNIGITPIWFERECFDFIEGILRLAKNELSYRGIFPAQHKNINTTSS